MASGIKDLGFTFGGRISHLILLIGITYGARADQSSNLRWSQKHIPDHINNYFLTMAQSTDGFYWLGGTSGLWRYDGKKFFPIDFYGQNKHKQSQKNENKPPSHWFFRSLDFHGFRVSRLS